MKNTTNVQNTPRTGEIYPRTSGAAAHKKASPENVARKRQRAADKLIRVLAVLITLLIITALVVAIVMLLMPPKASALEITSPCGKTELNSALITEDSLSSVILPFSGDKGTKYLDSLCFLGDSLTSHLISREVLSGGRATHQVLATKTGMLNLNSEITSAKVILPKTGEKMTIAEAIGIKRPSILIITLGTDWGVSYLGEADFKYCYSKLINAISEASPDTKMILQSIFPVTDTCKQLSNKKIDRANVLVRELCAEHGLRYLDTQSVLKDESGNLKNEFCVSDDGIHLTRQAYVEILKYIRTHALENK